MNEVETYLRESGKWSTPIDTDSNGHARPGRWWQTYYAQWLDNHDRDDYQPGGWTRDETLSDWWITDTPDWDRQWFQQRGVRPPKLFGDRANTYWEDYGDGLKGLAYRAPDEPVELGRWARFWQYVTGRS